MSGALVGIDEPDVGRTLPVVLLRGGEDVEKAGAVLTSGPDEL